MAAQNANEGRAHPGNAGQKGLPLTGTAQVLPENTRMVVVSTAGNIVGRLAKDAADSTYTLPVGVFPMAFGSITSSTAVGFLLF